MKDLYEPEDRLPRKRIILAKYYSFFLDSVQRRRGYKEERSDVVIRGGTKVMDRKKQQNKDKIESISFFV